MNKGQIIHVKKIPKRLAEIPDPPKILYAEGNLDILNRKDLLYVCIIGPRKSTPYGQQVAESILNYLSRMNVVTVSGAAYGIDGLVHSLSIKLGIPTIAIPGSGIADEVFYPRAHLDLKHEIIDSDGLILSEFEPHVRADKWTFPVRNRIMAGLSQLIIVVEAEKKSGTLITAHLGIDYGREILSVPGSIFSPTSIGTHLLANKGATILADMETLTEILTSIANRDQIILWKNPEESKSESSSKNQTTPISLDAIEKHIVECIQVHSEGVTKDQLEKSLRLTITEISIYLTILELKEIIFFKHGKIWLKDLTLLF